VLGRVVAHASIRRIWVGESDETVTPRAAMVRA
jgi:hypothetical protein